MGVGGSWRPVTTCRLFLIFNLSCVEVKDDLNPLGRGTVLLHSAVVGMMAAEGGGRSGFCILTSKPGPKGQ